LKHVLASCWTFATFMLPIGFVLALERKRIGNVGPILMLGGLAFLCLGLIMKWGWV
jgi:hypothetical protein